MCTQNDIFYKYKPLSESFNFLYCINGLSNPEKTIKKLL